MSNFTVKLSQHWVLCVLGVFVALFLGISGLDQSGQSNSRFSATVCYPIDGCTGTSTAPTADQILIGGATNGRYDVKRLVAGTNVTISTSSAQVTISASLSASSDAVSTSSAETAGHVPFWTTTAGSPARLGSVATSGVTINAPLTSAGTPGFVIGGSGWTLDVDDIAAVDLASADFGDFTCNGTTCSLDADTVADSEIDYTAVTLADFTNDANYVKNNQANTFTGGLQWFTANASTSQLTATSSVWFSTLTSAVVSADANGLLGEVSATTCTNQFVRAMSAAYVATCATVDISSDTNLTAGRSLTLTNDDVLADAELYTDSRTFNFASSTMATSTEPVLVWKVPQATTISTITCWDGGLGAATSTVDFEERTSPLSSGTDVLYGNGITAGGQALTASSTISNNSLASGSYLAMLIEGYLEGTPTNPICDVLFTYDD